jgi:hypothetical protein
MHHVRGWFLGEPSQPLALLPVGRQVFPQWLIKARPQGFLGQYLDRLAARRRLSLQPRQKIRRHVQLDRRHQAPVPATKLSNTPSTAYRISC